MSEFDLIERYFTRPAPSAALGVGDDAALVAVGAGKELAVSSDMLVCGTHFLADADPFLLGHKTLAVNLSDMAAMGAVPRWATLSLALPQADGPWLQRFSDGFFALADAHGVELVGGDTTRGPLNLCVTIMGEVPAGRALRRDGAQPDDDIWVSGTLGRAALGLAHLQGRLRLYDQVREDCLQALHQPMPRIALGLALRGIARSAIDISDGLYADLGHILQRSAVGAELEIAALPCVETGVEAERAQQCALGGGDDYELCFTAPAAARDTLTALAAQLDLNLTRIGKIRAGRGCVVRDAAGMEMKIEKAGYDHFA
ncbi:thiamine-phosphate kinase [Ferrigenium sp. UT5]|uniref:thiamine-phosphate kinase n=1 Tax=Ferrigenium sp. UT5 TaxID=3242105 RepID=UPI00354F7790